MIVFLKITFLILYIFYIILYKISNYYFTIALWLFLLSSYYKVYKWVFIIENYFIIWNVFFINEMV